MKRFIAFTLVAGSLAGCAKPIPPTFTATDVIDAQTTYNTLAALPPTAPAFMPTAGTGTYTGLIGGDFTGPDVGGSFLGDLTLDVDFAASSITGEAANINVIDNLGDPDQTLGGTLDVTGTVVSNFITADASGRLTGVADIEGTNFSVTGKVDVELVLGGTFRTDTVAADTITGGVTGTGTGDFVFGVTNGEFAVQR